MSFTAGSSRQPEAFNVKRIGGPLTQGGGAEGDVELTSWLFEVQGDQPSRLPWNVQRGYVEIRRLHEQLAALPGAALPRLPEPRAAGGGGGMKRLFRSRASTDDAEDQHLHVLADQLEEYLNTLLKIPGVGSCAILQLFLEIPQHVNQSQPEHLDEPTPTEIGQQAAESVAGTCADLCEACRAFCCALAGRERQASLLEDDDDGGTSMLNYGSRGARQVAVCKEGSSRTPSVNASPLTSPGRSPSAGSFTSQGGAGSFTSQGGAVRSNSFTLQREARAAASSRNASAASSAAGTPRLEPRPDSFTSKRSDSDQPQTGSFQREVNLPLDGKLVEWK